MAIRKEYGQISTIANLAQMAGEAEATQRALERSSQITRQLLDQKFRAEQAEIKHQWNLEAEHQRHAWNLQKMQIASENDFRVQEQKRLREAQELQNKLTAIDNATDILGEDERERAKLKEIAKAQVITGVPFYSKAVPQAKAMSEEERLLQQFGGSSGLPPVPSENKMGGIIGGTRDIINRVWHGKEGAEQLAAAPQQQAPMNVQQPIPEARPGVTYGIGDLIRIGGQIVRVTGYNPDGSHEIEIVQQPTDFIPNPQNIDYDFTGMANRGVLF